MEILSLLIKHWSWPITILVLAMIFKRPIQLLVSRLSSLNITGIEARFNAELDAQGLTVEQLESLRSLTASEIDLFLLVSFSNESGFSYRTEIPPEEFVSMMANLEKAGLISIKVPDLSGDNIRHIATPLGKRVRSMSVNSIVSMIKKKN